MWFVVYAKNNTGKNDIIKLICYLGFNLKNNQPP